jgi:hypothetical protein
MKKKMGNSCLMMVLSVEEKENIFGAANAPATGKRTARPGCSGFAADARA